MAAVVFAERVSVLPEMAVMVVPAGMPDPVIFCPTANPEVEVTLMVVAPLAMLAEVEEVAGPELPVRVMLAEPVPMRPWEVAGSVVLAAAVRVADWAELCIGTDFMHSTAISRPCRRRVAESSSFKIAVISSPERVMPRTAAEKRAPSSPGVS